MEREGLSRAEKPETHQRSGPNCNTSPTAFVDLTGTTARSEFSWRSLKSSEALSLQRSIGNQAVSRLAGGVTGSGATSRTIRVDRQDRVTPDTSTEPPELQVARGMYEGIINDLQNRVEDEIRDNGPVVVERLRSHMLRQGVGVSMSTAAQLDLALSTARTSRNALAWGDAAVKAVQFSEAIRRFDRIIRSDSPGPDTVRAASEDLALLGESTAEFLGSEIFTDSPLIFYLQSTVRAATQMGSAILGCIARRTERASSVVGPHMPVRGLGNENLNITTDLLMNIEEAGERYDAGYYPVSPGRTRSAIDGVSSKVSDLVEILEQRIVQSQAEQHGIVRHLIGNRHLPYYYGRERQMRERLAELRQQLIGRLYYVAADAAAANFLNVVVCANLAQETQLALNATRGATLPQLLAHGESTDTYNRIVEFGLRDTGLPHRLRERLSASREPE